MLPSQLLVQHKNENGLVIEGKSGFTLKFIATNLRTAHRWIHEIGGHYPSLSFGCNDSGIIILNIGFYTIEGRNKNWDWKYFIFEVLEGEIIFDRYWLPQKTDRLIVVRESSFGDAVEVLSESDKRYTTNPEPALGEYYVPDETLLCRYVVGEVEEDALQEAATLQAEEVSARKILPELQTVTMEQSELIEKLQKMLEIQDGNCVMFSDKFEQARKTVSAMRDKLDIALSLVGWWQGDLRKWIRTAINLANKEIPRKHGGAGDVVS